MNDFKKFSMYNEKEETSASSSAMGYSEGSEVPKEETQDDLFIELIGIAQNASWPYHSTLEELKTKYILTRR
jgi:hypothetical protein